jgi:4-hydroxybenzoate polyprenyltransferase
MLDIIKLLRPEQWAKNLFIFLPVFFSGQMLNGSALLSCAVAFAAFSLAASSIYCVNDIYDVEADRAHPEKRKRPVASGAVSVKAACTAAAICLSASLCVVVFFGGSAVYALVALILFYCVKNLAYCVTLKHYAIIDVVTISVGFVLRVFAGGVASGIRCSEWIIIMTFLLSLFLAFAKRRDDVILYLNTNVSPRKNTHRYNLEFMNQVMTVVATIAIIAYIMYTLSPSVIDYYNSRHIYLTAIFVLTGIIRYLQVTIVDVKSGSPTKILLHDRFIQCCIAGWVVTFLIIIYLKGIIAMFMNMWMGTGGGGVIK